MAEYSNLSATINAQIRANGVQAITGPVLNAVLTAMVNVLGDGYRLNGVAAPADNPGSPDNRVAYLAAQDGTYTNFGGLTISGEVALLLWDSAWTKETLFSIDTAVTPGSGNLVTSGAVDSALTTLANNIAAAYMQLVPAATEGNLAEFDNAGQVRDAGLATSDLAEQDGHYPDLFAGFAGNLVDTRSAGTHQSFAFRQSGGDGVNYMRKILGRTEAWNQHIKQEVTIGSNTHQWKSFDNGTTLTANNNELQILKSSGYGIVYYSLPSGTIITGHTYLMAVDIKTTAPADSIVVGAYGVDTTVDIRNQEATSGWQRIARLATAGPYTTSQQFRITDSRVSDFDTVYAKNFIFVDITLEGLGITTLAAFQFLHPLGNYAYNAGVLKNNAATGLETTGFNQWDEEWEVGSIDSYGNNQTYSECIRTTNYNPIFEKTYYLYSPNTGVVPVYYDANKNFILKGMRISNGQTFTPPTSAAYLRFVCQDVYGTTYNHDICINLSDPSRNGTYEPYWKRDIVLGLDNLACHDENNNAVVVNGLDGVGTAQDELIVENGWGTKINKKRKRVNLGDLTWINAVAANGFFRAVIPDMKQVADTIVGITSKYAPAAQANGQGLYNATEDKAFCTNGAYGGGVGSVAVRDSSFANYTTAQVAAALDGVMLDFELATPKVLTLDNPIPALIEVDNLGTEKRLPEDTADNPQGPFECDSNYSISTANLVRLLNL